jgi:hypothetical protein
MRTKRPGRRALAGTAAVTLAVTALGAGLGAATQADPWHSPQPSGGNLSQLDNGHFLLHMVGLPWRPAICSSAAVCTKATQTW